MSNSLPPLPRSLKKIKPFLARARELDKKAAKGGTSEAELVAFYCRKHAAELAANVFRDSGGQDADAGAFLGALLDQIEGMRPSLPKHTEEEAFKVVSNFAAKIFKKADDVDRSASASTPKKVWKSTAQMFYFAGNFGSVLKQFGTVPDDVKTMTKYAMFKASDITKALKRGDTPVSGPPGGEQGNDSPPGGALKPVHGVGGIPAAPNGSANNGLPAAPSGGGGGGGGFPDIPAAPSGGGGGGGFPDIPAAPSGGGGVNVPLNTTDPDFEAAMRLAQNTPHAHSGVLPNKFQNPAGNATPGFDIPAAPGFDIPAAPGGGSGTGGFDIPAAPGFDIPAAPGFSTPAAAPTPAPAPAAAAASSSSSSAGGIGNIPLPPGAGVKKVSRQEQLLKQAMQVTTGAIQLDNSGKLAEALDKYKESLTLFMQLLKETPDQKEKNELMIRVDAYMKRAEQIKTMLKQQDDVRGKNLGPAPPLESINPLLLINATSAKLREGIKMVSLAISKDNDGAFREALKLYTGAMEKLMGGLGEERNPKAKSIVMNQLDDFLDRAEELKRNGFHSK
eukprot:g5979.t1